MEKQQQAYVYALMTVLFWVTVASAFKLTLRYLSFIELLFYSSAASAVVLFIVLIVQNKLKILWSYTKREYMQSALLGFMNPFFYYFILFKAYELLRAQEAQPLNQTWAIILPILSIILLKQKIKFMSILAILISFFGVIIISTQGNLLGFQFTDPLGVGLALFSAIIWALFWIYNIKDRRDEVAKLFLNFGFGFIYILITMILITLLTEPESIASFKIPASYGLLGAVYVGIFEMGITFIFWLKALKLSKTTAQVSNFIYLVPFLSLIVIHFTVGEQIFPSTVVGLCFIIAGILLQQYISRTSNNDKKRSKTKARKDIKSKKS
jgi:drug/metabolite transporter (DMT)-like permease